MNSQWTEVMQRNGLQPSPTADAGSPGGSEATDARPADNAHNDPAEAAGQTAVWQTNRDGQTAGPGDSGLTLYDNSPLAVIDAEGRDAASFLQSQFCNDLSALPAGRAQISGYCTPKGRLIAVFTVFAVDPTGAAADPAGAGPAEAATRRFRLLLPAGIADGFLKRLRMFVLRADVTFTRRDDLVCMGLSARHSSDLADQLAAPLGADSTDGTAALQPQAAALSVSAVTPDISLLRWHDTADAAQARYLLIGPVERQLAVWNSQAASATLANHAAWRLGDIAAGLPRVDALTLEAFVPQMINLHLIGALSFTKGCYPGQEIVARMQYRGKLKRHLRRFRLMPSGLSVPQPGTAVSAGADANAGEVIDAIRADDVIEVLAVVKVAATDLQIGSQTLEALDLPYDLPTLGTDIDAGLPPVTGTAGAES